MALTLIVVLFLVTLTVVEVRLAECKRERRDDNPEAIATERAYFRTVRETSS